jgi:hypothetical protein
MGRGESGGTGQIMIMASGGVGEGHMVGEVIKLMMLKYPS